MFHMKRVSIVFIALSLCFILAYPAYASVYTVESGDSLYTIGKLFNTNAGTIMGLNKLSNNMIYPGQGLSVPTQTYTVKSGDSLFLVAKKYGITVTTLKKINNQQKDMIYIGQKLILPSSASISNGSTVSSTAKGTIVYTAADLDLLARLITAEAGGEPYNAKVAVGAVVINRVRDARFPNTISGVIYEKDNNYYQFTPVENGWINKPASQDAKNAAYDALHGSDPTKGAVYYFDDSSKNAWLWAKPLAIRIDKMIFTY